MKKAVRTHQNVLASQDSPESLVKLLIICTCLSESIWRFYSISFIFLFFYLFVTRFLYQNKILFLDRYKSISHASWYFSLLRNLSMVRQLSLVLSGKIVHFSSCTTSNECSHESDCDFINLHLPDDCPTFLPSTNFDVLTISYSWQCRPLYLTFDIWNLADFSSFLTLKSNDRTQVLESGNL